MGSNRNIVVVPDGLETDAAGRPLPRPSFVYRWVLDWVAEHVEAGDHILLAPANRFGGDVSEQEAARRYLVERGVEAPIVCCEVDFDSYLGTRENARFLRRHLESIDRWPLPRATLVSYATHLPRARIVFRQEGFAFETAIPVPAPHFEPGLIVRRLRYYRTPFWHRLYEVGAIVGSLLRIV
jgi:uncharacterized SAM-binding protein YcdF (DUF218 family)